MLNAKFATSFPGSLNFPPPGEPQAPKGGKMRDPGNDIVLFGLFL